MPLSPRTLRPANTFTPRSISGLALWLDASASGDLYTTDAGPVVPVSSPTEISGCALWLDGADSSAASMTLNGSLVETWKDKSGNNRNATASGTARPTLTGSALNGRSVVTFDGTANQMQIDGTFLVTSNATIFAVARRTSGGFGAVITSKGTGDTSPALQHASGSWQINHAGNLSVIGAQAGYAVLSGTISAGATAAFANGLLQDSDASSGSLASDATKTYIGTYRAAIANVLAGEIAEIIVFNTALSTADRARVEAYLAQRWGITGVHAAATSASDPVGYWRDRSGNGRHAVQATGANRPAVGSAVSNGRRGVNFGTASNSQRLSWVPLSGTQDWQEVFAVGIYDTAASTFADNHTMFGGTTSSLNDIGWQGEQTQNGVSYIYGTFARRSNVNAIEAVDNALVRPFPAITSPFLLVTRNTNNTQATGFQVGNDRTVANRNWRGRVSEVIAYARSLTSTERARVARYLAAKYGIALAPQVSNADAQDWVNRVYANGGTVSASTAAAVNQFCLDIENAPGGSIRDRFYRLNLFCGTGLNACLVPLYRGQSLGGTQFGGATDTNVGPFVSGDYNETGASGGLTGNGSSKYLQTGLPPSAFITGGNVRSHLAVYKRTSTNSGVLLSARSTTLGNSWEFGAGGNLVGGSSGSFPVPSTHDSLIGVTRTTNTDIYAFRRTSLSSLVTASASVTGTSIPFAVFARNDQSTDTNAYSPNLYSNQTLAAYSIGLGLDATQLAAYDTAMQAFQTALQRNV